MTFCDQETLLILFTEDWQFQLEACIMANLSEQIRVLIFDTIKSVNPLIHNVPKWLDTL